MSTVLVTGSNGFVGNYLIHELLKGDDKKKIVGFDIHEKKDEKSRFQYFKCDISNKNEVQDLIFRIKPSMIYHFAAISMPQKAEQNPLLTYNVNFNGTLNILESSRLLNKKVRILITGSSECYGLINNIERVDENYICKPLTHYGVSKYMSEVLAVKYSNYSNLDVMCTRSFNHTGPGQMEGFVVPDFAKQAALIALGKKDPEITVGKLDVVRDFLDVRDVIKAYRLIMFNGKSGEVYNVCSGEGISISKILETLLKLTGRNDITIRKQSLKIRKIENQSIVGDNTRLKSLGWERITPIQETLTRIFNYWKTELKD